MSVVVPAYNAEMTLGAAIDSVLGQTFSDLEVLVVDDGSTDSTATLARGYGAPVVCLSTPNGGVSRARNLGIERATGDYIALLDSDDVWMPPKLERQVELLDEQPDVGLCFTGITRVDEQLRPLGETPAEEYDDFCEGLLLRSMVVTCSSSSALIRAHLLREIGGFDPSFSQCADWDLDIRLSLRTRFAPIDDPLVLYRTYQGNMSSDIELLEQDTFAVLEKFFHQDVPARYAGLKRRCYSNHWMIVSGSYLEIGRRRDALRCLLNGLRLYPGNVRRPLGLPYRRLRRALAGAR